MSSRCRPGIPASLIQKLAVERPALRADHRLLRVLVLQLLGQRIRLELLRALVELDGARLEHVREAEIALRIDPRVERAFGILRALHRNGEFAVLQRARIEAAKELLVE